MSATGNSPRLHSTITCPHCGVSKRETMPDDACQWFYECTSCHALLKPNPGDCCVFCSYGTVKCPSRSASPAADPADCCAGTGRSALGEREAGRVGRRNTGKGV